MSRKVVLAAVVAVLSLSSVTARADDYNPIYVTIPFNSDQPEYLFRPHIGDCHGPAGAASTEAGAFGYYVNHYLNMSCNVPAHIAGNTDIKLGTLSENYVEGQGTSIALGGNAGPFLFGTTIFHVLNFDIALDAPYH